MSRKPTQGIDYTSRDYEAYRELLIQKLQEKMPEYTDTSETDAGIVILEAFANGLDIMSLYADIVANDVILTTTQDRKLAVIIARCLGYYAYNQTAAEYQQVFVLSKPQEDDVVIPQGTVVKTSDDNDLVTLTFETMEDLIIPAGCLGNELDEDGYYKYTVTVIHGTTVSDDVIGTSSGTPLQSFQLNYTGVLIDSIELYVDEGDGQILWERVDSFLDCDENSRVYMTSVDEFDVCTIEFGNGIKGKIPNAYENGIVANYMIGGGSVGNVSEGIINDFETGISFVDSTFNLEADVLGHDKEELESIKQNAPAAYRSRDRLVTDEDYEDLLRINFLNFLQVKSVRDKVDKKLIHLFYMLRPDYKFDVVEEVATFISKRSMIGTTYDITEYTRQYVNIEAKMYVDADYDKDEIEANVRAYLEGVTFFYGNLVFGSSLVKSDLENEIKDMFPGILSFRINAPEQDIISPTAPQNVLVLGTVNITAVYPTYN